MADDPNKQQSTIMSVTMGGTVLMVFRTDENRILACKSSLMADPLAQGAFIRLGRKNLLLFDDGLQSTRDNPNAPKTTDIHCCWLLHPSQKNEGREVLSRTRRL
jgi:hypothetical protein